MRRWLALLILLGSPAMARGPRVVSINPCIDAVLMRVADAGQIAAISHYSQEADATSIPLAVADRFHAISGTAEEVVALAPDIVLTGPHTAPSTVQALRRMGVKLIEYPIPATIEESEAQMRSIAAAVGHPVRGVTLAGAIAAAVRAARPPAGPPVPALIWGGGGLVPGSGTLADALLRRTGFTNLSASYGLKQWDVLPLEYLVAKPPRVLFSVGAAEAGGDRMLKHPAVRDLAKRIAVVPYPQRLLFCAGPTIIDATRLLAATRRAVAGVVAR